MDRGFTVEGLTVTYMPRGVGTRTANTIQQRARFFGYKRQYLGYCRVYLEAAALDAYVRYVDHEEDLRSRLVSHRRTGRPLADFRRAFFLDLALRPTRDSVMDLNYRQSKISEEWFTPAAPHASEEAVVSNRQVVEEFVAGIDFRPTRTTPRGTMNSEMCRSAMLMRGSPILLRFTRAADSQRFTGLLLQIKKHLDSHQDEVCRIYRMNGGNSRRRSLTSADEVDQLFEGPGAMYPGDRAIRSPEGMTIQLHSLGLARAARGQAVLPDIPTIAAWLPREMARGTLVQEEP